mgnify:CR=1 FL=1
MKHTTLFTSVCIVIAAMLQGCNKSETAAAFETENWQRRIVNISPADSLESGQTYLPVYSEIYSRNDQRTEQLTATVSMRNTSADSIYILDASYFDTKGHLIKSYFDKPIYLAPMETVEIIIADTDKKGGTGANFIFDWKIKPGTPLPLFEAIMISTSGSMGISFTSRGIRTK